MIEKKSIWTCYISILIICDVRSKFKLIYVVCEMEYRAWRQASEWWKLVKIDDASAGRFHKHKIINYCRYKDDILLILDSNHTNIHMILEDFINLKPKLQFTAEAERDHTLNFLDISVHRITTNIETATYGKPIFTDTTIPHTYNHPKHHKLAAVRFHFNRLRLLQSTGRRIWTCAKHHTQHSV